MAEKELPLLSRFAEVSEVDGASGCEQAWHIPNALHSGNAH